MEIVHTARFETSEGGMLAASCCGKLIYLGLPRASGRGFQGFVAQHLASAPIEEGYAHNRGAIRQVQEFLEGKRHGFELEFELYGTVFQREVWSALRAIPYGATRTYGEIASSIGKPGAMRAVGAASGANPLPLVIPCHRVVAAGGKLGGFGGGLPLKRRLLAMEGASPSDDRLL